MDLFEALCPQQPVIDFDSSPQHNVVVLLREEARSPASSIISITTFEIFYTAATVHKKEVTVDFPSSHLALMQDEVLKCGVLSTNKLLYIYEVAQTLSPLTILPLSSFSPLVDFFFVACNCFVTLSIDETVLLAKIQDFQRTAADISYNFNKEKSESLDFYLNATHILFKQTEGILLFELSSSQRSFFCFDDFPRIKTQIYLFSFLKGNGYYTRCLKAEEACDGGRRTKRKSQITSFDQLIDDSLREKFTTLKQEKKNRFGYLLDEFLIFISKSEYVLDFFDLKSKLRFQLHNCFKAIWLVVSPFIYSTKKDGLPMHLITVFGFKELFGFLVSMESSEKAFISVFFINDLEYCVTKACFVDPYRLALHNEAGKLNVISFDRTVIAPFFSVNQRQP